MNERGVGSRDVDRRSKSRGGISDGDVAQRLAGAWPVGLGDTAGEDSLDSMLRVSKGSGVQGAGDGSNDAGERRANDGPGHTQTGAQTGCRHGREGATDDLSQGQIESTWLAWAAGLRGDQRSGR